MKAEGVEEGQQEKEADHAKNNDDQDGVHLHVQLLPWEQRSGGQEGCRGYAETGLRSHCGLHGRQAGDLWHDQKMCALRSSGNSVGAFRGNTLISYTAGLDL